MYTLPAPAKLNLFLHITGRRPDGYHNLQTVFQLLDHGDRLQFTPLETADLHFTCSDPELAGSDNLVLQAIHLLLPFRQQTSGWHIHLDKRLPHGAGLGGGSSDAATTLLAMNRLWCCGLDEAALLRLGQQLGADVPVFIRGWSSWAEGTGEQLHKMALPEHWYLVLSPACRVATGELFGHPELTRDSPPLRIAAFPFSGCKNDCETVACMLYPEIEQTLNWLKKQTEAGAGDSPESGITARMTGTGSSVFAGFPAKEQAEEILARLPNQYRVSTRGFIARGVNVSPLCALLEKLPVQN